MPPPSGAASSASTPAPTPASSAGRKAAASGAAGAAPAAWGDKMRLRSERVPISSAAGYYSGLVHEGALHLHPVSGVLQFRTTLGYLDGPEAPAPRAPDEAHNDGSGSLKDFRNKMWAMAGREQAEPWVPYAYRDGDEGLEAVERLVIDAESRTHLELASRPLDYLDRE